MTHDQKIIRAKPASIASKELSSKSSSKGEKTVAGSDLSQAKKSSVTKKK